MAEVAVQTPEQKAEDLRAYKAYNTPVNNGGTEYMYFVDDDLASINMVSSNWEENRLTDEQIITSYRMLKQNQGIQTMMNYNHGMVLLLAYSGMREVENDEHLFKNMLPYKEQNPQFNSEYVFGKKHKEILEKVSTTVASSSATKIEEFLKQANIDIKEQTDSSWKDDDQKSIAIKISCYCLAMLTATVKQEKSVTSVLNKIDDYVNNRFYNKATNFKMSANGLSTEFIMNFGNAVQQTPMVNTMIFHTYNVSLKSGAKTKNLLHALLLTRICKHGLPVYTLAAPLAILHCQSDGKVNMMKIIRLGLSSLTLSSVENFFQFQMKIEMPYEEYKKQPEKYRKKAERVQESDVIYWPIARALNPSFLQCLGRRFNADLINFLVSLNKKFGFMQEVGSEFSLPKSRFTNVEVWADAAAATLQQDLNPTHLMDPRVLEEYNKRQASHRVEIDDSSSIDG